MNKGIVSKWECPACGNILRAEEALVVVASKYSFKGPKKCACGRTKDFSLLEFESATVKIVPDKDEENVTEVTSSVTGLPA